MLDRWAALCRRVVPKEVRATAFDPAVDDLRAEDAERSRHRPGAVGRALARLRLAARMAIVALQCLRLPAHAATLSGPHPSTPQRWLAMWRYELGQSIRLFVRRPGFAATAVLTLAFGIGANLAVFSFVNTFLLAPVPVPDPAGLVRVHGIAPSTRTDVVSFPDYSDARTTAQPSLDLAAHAQRMARVVIGETPENRTVELVTGNYFRVLGLGARAGRLLDERDDIPEGAHPVLVISDQLARARFGGSNGAIGQRVLVNRTPFEIVGVAPAGFRGTFNSHRIDLWAPLSMQQAVQLSGRTLMRRGWGWLSMIGRVRRGVPLQQVQGGLDAAAADIKRRFPTAPGGTGFAMVRASALEDGARGSVTPFLALVFGFTALLFVVTCANLAGLMQARLLSRTRELAIRQSLGAGRGRLAVAWLAESLVLSMAGAVAGVAVSRLISLLVARVTLPTQLLGDITFETTLDARVWAHALGVALVASLLFGLSPAFRAGRTAPLDVLKADGGTITTSRRGLRLRRIAVFVQVAVSVVLLVAAGLLAAGLVRERALDPGYQTDALGLLSFNLQGQGIEQSARQDAARRLLDQIRAEPGVTNAELAMTVPLALGRDRMRFRVPGYREPDGSANVSIEFNTVGARYFSTLGIPFVAGRSWVPEQIQAGEPPIVITEAMARRYWKDGQALGELVELVGTGMLRVSGIVRDTAYHEIGEAPLPIVFLPAELQTPGSFTVLIRTSGDSRPALHRLERSLPALDSRFAPFDVLTFEDLRAVPLFPARMLLIAAGAFGILALALTGLGLYGVVASSVAQRTREIGVRMALGARPVDVLRGILREAGALVALGTFSGGVGAYFLAQTLRVWLARLPTFDPLVAIVVALLLAGFAVIAAWAPARKAARIDPVDALRH
jgi:predicted permease